MLIEAMIISLIIGLIRGGKLKRFKTLNHKTIWFLIFGILTQYILVFLNKAGAIGSLNKILFYTKEILIISYILILIGLFTNLKFKSLWLSLIGFILNFFVLISNNWKIPILMEGIPLINSPNLKELLEKGNTYLYTPIMEGTKYPVLGDIIVFSKPYPIPKIISFGDLLIGFSIFLLIQEIMLSEDSFMGGYRL
jgi:hypothetical protein